METTLIILFGAFAGGFVSGLSGFGTGMIALAFWLYVAPPALAVPMVVVCSLIAHLQTLPKIWGKINLRQVLPFVIGGVFGVPVGVQLLSFISVAYFKFFLGIAIVGYCSFMLSGIVPTRKIRGGQLLHTVIGLSGGILSGFAGLSGVLPSIWSAFTHWTKQEKRQIFQCYNLIMSLVALASLGLAGLVTTELITPVGIALPGTVVGVWLGHRLYNRIGDYRFNQAIYWILIIAGTVLVASSV